MLFFEQQYRYPLHCDIMKQQKLFYTCEPLGRAEWGLAQFYKE